MRATANRSDLLNAVRKAKLATSSRASLPILGSVLFWGSKGQIIVTGSDLETSISVGCKANISKKGAICVSPKPVEAFLKVAKEDKVTLSVMKKSLKLEAGATSIIEGWSAEEYPSIPKVKGKPITIKGLPAAIKQVAYAMAQEQARPVLNGALFQPDGIRMNLVAADGFRLATTKLNCTGSIRETIVPYNSINLLQRLLPDKVEVYRTAAGKRDQGHITFKANGLIVSASVIEGKFPDYKQVIPNNGRPLTVEVKPLKDALDIVAITADNARTVKLQTRRGKLTLSTQDGESMTLASVPAKGNTEIAFNLDYLRDLLNTAGDTITLRTVDRAKPGCVRNNGTVHVLMPMFVQW